MQPARHRPVRRPASHGSVARWHRKPAVTATTVHYARVPRLFADLDWRTVTAASPRLFRMLNKADLLDPRRLAAGIVSIRTSAAI